MLKLFKSVTSYPFSSSSSEQSQKDENDEGRVPKTDEQNVNNEEEDVDSYNEMKSKIFNSPLYKIGNKTVYNIELKEFDNFILNSYRHQREVVSKHITVLESGIKKTGYLYHPIILCDIPSRRELTIIDGQHRLSMFQKIYKEGINNNIRCNIIICNNTEEMYNIYNKLNINNKDIYDNCEITNIINYNKYILIKNNFENNYKNHFINNTTNEHIYHIEEYVRKLKDNKFLQNFNHLNEAIEYHDHVNKIYLKYYTNISIYTEIERKRLNSSIVFTLKKNNFLDYLLTPEKKCLSFQHLHKKTL